MKNLLSSNRPLIRQIFDFFLIRDSNRCNLKSNRKQLVFFCNSTRGWSLEKLFAYFNLVEFNIQKTVIFSRSFLNSPFFLAIFPCEFYQIFKRSRFQKLFNNLLRQRLRCSCKLTFLYLNKIVLLLQEFKFNILTKLKNELSLSLAFLR